MSRKNNQATLVGQIITEQDVRLKECLEKVQMKTTLKRVYPGMAFEIGISDKDRDKIDDITDPQKQRTFIIKKMRPMAGAEIAARREGIVYQDDLEMFHQLVFVTKAMHMSKESFDVFMTKKEEGIEEEEIEV